MNMDCASGASSDGGWQSLTSCARILLVDKNPASLVYTASLLQEQLYNVSTATSAAMALNLFEARKGFYDIVMADFHLQDMGIFEFMQHIRNQCLTRTPIILMAEDYQIDVVKEALKNGASFCFKKPVQPCNIAILWQHLWPQILSFPGRQPGASTFKKGKRVLIDSENRNGKRRDIPNAQDDAIIKKLNHARRHHPNTVCYTLNGVQQIVNRLNSNNALNGTSENVIMNSEQVVGENGVQIFMEEGQVTPTDGHLADAFQIPNQEASNDLNTALNGVAEDVMMNTRSDQVAGENGVQTFMEEGQVTPTNGYLTNAFQIPNQEASDGPSDAFEAQLTLDDISEILRDVNGEDI